MGWWVSFTQESNTNNWGCSFFFLVAGGSSFGWRFTKCKLIWSKLDWTQLIYTVVHDCDVGDDDDDDDDDDVDHADDGDDRCL